MIKIFLCVFFTFVAADIEKANVVLINSDGLSGIITFVQQDDKVSVSGTITGIPEGKHGFHVHEKGDLSDGCTSAAGHFNPLKKNHGAPEDNDRHIGDLGNIVANASKIAVVEISDSLISLNGVNSILGRAIVVHADEDDLGRGNFTDSKTTGHAGNRLACGIIAIVDDNDSSSAISITKNLVLLTATILIVKLII